MTEKSRAYEAKRYAGNKKKRIAAEKAYTEKVKNTPARKAKVKARHKVESGAKGKPPKKCPNCGATGVVMEFHHTDYSTGKGQWKCSRCNKRGSAVK